jgi:hypothetical protein
VCLAASHALAWLAANYWGGQERHLAAGAAAVAQALADLWCNQRERAKVAGAAEHASSSDSEPPEGSGSTEPVATSAAGLKRLQRTLLGSIRNVVPESGAATLADVLVNSGHSVLGAHLPGGDAPEDATAWDAAASASAATLSLLAEQHSCLAAHVLLRCSERLRSAKAELLRSLLLDAGAAGSAGQSERVCSVALLYRAAHKAVSACQALSADEKAKLCMICQSTVQEVPPLAGVSGAERALAVERYYATARGEGGSDAVRCASALAAVEGQAERAATVRSSWLLASSSAVASAASLRPFVLRCNSHSAYRPLLYVLLAACMPEATSAHGSDTRLNT